MDMDENKIKLQEAAGWFEIKSFFFLLIYT